VGNGVQLYETNMMMNVQTSKGLGIKCKYILISVSHNVFFGIWRKQNSPQLSKFLQYHVEIYSLVRA